MHILNFFSQALLACYAVASPASPSSLALSLRESQVPGPSDMLTFLCDQLPDICTNMCYGAVCRGIGQTLVYDKADAATKRQRRKTAGCIASGGNRCSQKNNGGITGLQCDEYPFASTSDGGNSERINRCVPAQQNRMQGGTINGFYRGSFCNGGPCTFDINFGNPGNIPYCEGPDNCPANGDIDDMTQIPYPADSPTTPDTPGDGDDAEDGTDGPYPDGDEEPEVSKRKVSAGKVLKYRTKLGLEIAAPGGATIGQRTWWPSPKNATLWAQQVKADVFGEDEEDGEYDDLVDNIFWNEDFIVEEIE